MSNLKQLRKLLEAQVEEAESIIAARGFSQELQDMIQKLGRLLNEDLPAVADQMRHSLGADIATAFEDQTTTVLQGVLDNLRDGKQNIDNSVAEIGAGGIPSDLGDSPINDMDLDLDDADLDLEDEEVADELEDLGDELDDVADQEDQFGLDDVAAGGDEPLGRARRESVQALGRRIVETQQRLLRLRTAQRQ